MHGVLAAGGQHRHDKHQNAHAAYPVGKLPPKQVALGHGLDIAENRGAGGGEAGDGLKHGVDIIGYAAAYYKGQRADKGHEYPAQTHDGKAVPCEKPVVPGAKQAQKPAHRGGSGKGYHKIQHIFPIAQPRDEREQQQPRKAQENGAEHAADHSIVHYLSSIIAFMSLSRPAAVIIMA